MSTARERAAAEDVDRLREEVRLLNAAARDDERNLRELKVALEVAQLEISKAARKSDEDEKSIRHLQGDLHTLSKLRFQAQTEAKTQETRAASLSEADEERRLLAQQADADAETIRALQREVDEIAYARDRALDRATAAETARDEAVSQMEVLEQHASQLRGSNAALADKVEALEAELSKLKDEDIGDWFVRNGRADQRRLAELRRQRELIADTNANAQRHHADHAPQRQHQHHQHQQQAASSSSSTAAPTPKQSPSASDAAHRHASTATYGEGRNAAPGGGGGGANGGAMLGKYEDISKEVLSNTMMTATGMSHRGALSSDDDGDDSRDATLARVDSSAGNTGGSFATVRALRRQRSDAAGEATRRAGRAATPPLEIEAIYGEKGSGEERMYLIKYRGILTEQWSRAADVAPCEALSQWRTSKALDRRHAVGTA